MTSPETRNQPAEAGAAPLVGTPLSLRSLSKRYGDVAAVKNVSLEVDAGQFVTLLGPSGSGKTTTLMMVAGFVEPDSGELVVDGRDITRLTPQRRGLGFVFQQYLLFPHMTVAQNIAFPLQLRKVGRAETRRRVADMIDLVGLGAVGNRKPRELSGGQQQRVALCRALVYQPPVLLMDEPMGALDKKLRDQLQLEVKRIQTELGLTVLYVTHDQEEALVMSDRIVVMRDGVIDQHGSPQELFERPRTKFVADFLGAANFLDGTVTSADRTGCTIATTGGGSMHSTYRASVGDKVVASITPPRLKIATPGEGFVNGLVVNSTYVGSIVRLAVRIEGREDVVRVDTPAGQGPTPGDAVGLTARPEDVIVFGSGEK